MSFEEIAANLGVPGVMIACWYLLEMAKVRRQGLADRDTTEIRKAEVEAMRKGFETLGTKIDEHTRVDLRHHSSVLEGVTELRGILVGGRKRRK